MAGARNRFTKSIPFVDGKPRLAVDEQFCGGEPAVIALIRLDDHLHQVTSLIVSQVKLLVNARIPRTNRATKDHPVA